MINIAICDDNKAVCSQIESTLINYARRNGMKIDTDVFYTGESLLDYLNMGNSFDLIYLDIKMGKMNGVEVGRQIRKVLKDYMTEIVYISGNDGYDRQLFDIQPLHFIPKPIDSSIVIDDLKLALERAQKSAGVFKYKKGYDTYKIPVKDILYFESRDREMKIVTTTGESLFYGNMEETLLSLSRYRFLKIHRSYLINYKHIIIMRYAEVVMSNGAVLPISRSKRQELRNLQMEEE